mgnify:CR=1 FL=1|tara:strand:- start:180 stop:1004 length:825 start_codon:yes stop_codon:yes gene_type:complete
MIQYVERHINNTINDKSCFAELLRSARHTHTGVNDWKQVFALQENNAHIIWDNFSNGRKLFVDKDDIISKFIKLHNCKNYLEIGGQPFAGQRSTYHKIQCENKDSVNTDPTIEFEYDLPAGSNHYVMTSDEFFEKVKDSKKSYDIVFIDAWHEHKQVLRDINNSLENLTDNGTIILHDMIPLTRDLEKDPHRTGCCWRAFADLRATKKDIDMSVLVPPWGSEDSLGIIRKGQQALFEKKIEYNYDFLLDNMEELMNLIDLDVFYKKYIETSLDK